MLKIHRNKIEDEKFVLYKLNEPDNFKCCQAFDCGNADLNEFFSCDARPHADQLIATTYCFKSKEAIHIPIAFVSLSNDAIIARKKRNLEALRTYLTNKIPDTKQYPTYPAVKIGRLGVASTYQGNNAGSYILNFIKELFLDENRTGCRFITVDAYNKENVIKFYKKNNFDFIHDKDKSGRTRSMYFDLKNLKCP